VYLTVKLYEDKRHASEDDLAEMKSHLEVSVNEGAWGRVEEKREVFVIYYQQMSSRTNSRDPSRLRRRSTGLRNVK